MAGDRAGRWSVAVVGLVLVMQLASLLWVRLMCDQVNLAIRAGVARLVETRDD